MSEEGKPAEESRRELIRVSSQFLGHGMTFAASVALTTEQTAGAAADLDGSDLRSASALGPSRY